MLNDNVSAMLEQMAALRQNVASLPEPETDEQRQVVDSLNELVRLLDNFTASTEDYLNGALSASEETGGK